MSCVAYFWVRALVGSPSSHIREMLPPVSCSCSPTIPLFRQREAARGKYKSLFTSEAKSLKAWSSSTSTKNSAEMVGRTPSGLHGKDDVVEKGKDVADQILLFVSHFKDARTTSFERHVRPGQITSFRFARSSRQGGQRFYPIDVVEVDVGFLPVEGLLASILNSHLGDPELKVVLQLPRFEISPQSFGISGKGTLFPSVQPRGAVF